MSLADPPLELRISERLLFGPGAVAELPALVSATGRSHALVVTDRGVVASGVIATVEAELRRGAIGTTTWDGVEPNPGLATCAAAARTALGPDAGRTCIVAVGGGSAIDTAKVVALAAANPFRAVAEFGYDDPALADGLPIIAVPTTAGTGAETNSFGVITDETAGRKTYIGHRSLLPVASVLDPLLTHGLPRAATAATGIDAMTHSLESLLSRRPNQYAEAIALGVVRTVAEWLPQAVADGADHEARSRMLMASHLAGLGQASGTGVGAVHALAHAIGTRCRVAHGTALAAVLPEVLATYLGVRARELALVAVAVGAADPRDRPADAAAAAIEALSALLEHLDQRPGLAALGLSQELESVVVADALDDPAIASSPRTFEGPDLAAILSAARAAPRA